MSFKSDAHRRWWFAVGQYENTEDFQNYKKGIERKTEQQRQAHHQNYGGSSSNPYAGYANWKKSKGL